MERVLSMDYSIIPLPIWLMDGIGFRYLKANEV